MIKKTIPYTDYNDVERVEDFYFNLNKAELTEMNVSEKGGLESHMKMLIAEEDGAKILETIKHVILSSYGKKSVDGKQFIKNPEQTKAFEQSEAYSELYVELFKDGAVAAEFFKGLLPKSMQAEAEKNLSSIPAPPLKTIR